MQRWQSRIKTGKKADKRHKRHPLVLEEPSRLALVVEENESVVIRDKKSGAIVMVVMRNFCNDDEVVQYADGVTQEATDMRKSGRLEDPGKLVLLGYTAGARSHPKFDWSKNLRSTRHTAEFIKEHNFHLSSVFALFWNLLLSHLPDEVLEPFETYLAENQMCRMDGNGAKERKAQGIYMVERGSECVEFNDAELAPPSGVAGCNYARQVPLLSQKWAFSWTTSRREGMTGGSFYEAIFGIKVLQAPNTMVAWMPEHDHGTSLLDWSPDKKDDVPPFAQAGIALVTSTRLASTWKKYLAEHDFEEAEREWVASMEADVEEKCGDELCTFCLDDGYECTDDLCPICVL
ncbi:uncharacterized protein C8Q71DRAFT_700010 [Rhodofomes roseus]|uniref:Uncharacterized protein n=1 Tax=Rhodofomes roseus TaxID=34475 RepID=A0ABQ8KRD7_9APHY|nr:uncharacterized protein C8Q71DRAFT_700010 [Rhodofomes roseus]KAH9841338.1 hypothetical protein C8Q71DRAFT_700010 [Rhodofomes roseus]